MHLTKPLALAATSAVLAGGGAAAIAQGQSTTPTPAQEIDFKIAGFSNKYLDAKPKGPSTGDRFIDKGRLVNPAGGASLGYILQACDYAKVGKKELSNCAGGLQLRAGRITFSDAGTDEGRVTHVAITGGTGAYSTARGTIAIDAGKKENGKNITGKVLIQP
jgi:hypothetical protein